jgi:hypothetical protein
MSTYPRWIKQRVAINSADWTPIAAPQNYDYLAIRCDSCAITYRTDPADAATEDTLAIGIQDGVLGSAVGPHINWSDANKSRFPAGESILWVKSDDPTAELVVTWVL